jgi:hypothetical protein
MTMNPERKLHRAILDALKEFPGVERIVIRFDRHGIEVIFNHGGRAAGREFFFRPCSDMDNNILRDFLCRMFHQLVKSVRPNHPGPGAAWGGSERP